MTYIVTSGGDSGRFVEVEAATILEAAEKGADRLLEEWPGEFHCGTCEAPEVPEVHAIKIEYRGVFEFGRVIQEKRG